MDVKEMVESLIKYQEEDKKLKAIERELGGSPERKQYVSAKKFLEFSKENFTKMEIRSAELLSLFDEYQKQHTALKESGKDYEGNIVDSCEDVGEIDYISKKAAQLVARVEELERKIMRLSEEITAIYKEYSDLKKKYSEKRKDYEVVKSEYQKVKSEKQKEADAINENLKQLEKDIPENAMKKYKDKRADGIFPILFEYSGAHCSNCNTEFSKADENKLKNDGIIVCSNCGRVIYFK